jgi:magnesium chelatase subunit D
MDDRRPDYPFAALVGQEQLKTALLLNALDPAIGGVLIRGEKGTAKSTAARALAALVPPLRRVAGCSFNCDPAARWPDCPHCSTLSDYQNVETPVPFIELPLGATEDRVLGTLDFERALREGRRAFQPGLLAAAHRGLVYIDEVNLLANHLVDVLLDAAALGVNTVQREGVAVTHPARFFLVGTMNPEEGDLRPQLLDRFGLAVTVVGPREPELRAEVVRRRIGFEADPAAFVARWADEQDALRHRVVAARERLPHVALDDGVLTLITRLCCELEVDGLRADIGLYRTARALASLDRQEHVTVEHVRAAAELVLPHRRRRRPFEQPGLDRSQLDDLLAQLNTERPSPDRRQPPTKMETSLPPLENGASSQNEHSPAPPHDDNSGKQVFAPVAPEKVRRLELAPSGKASWNGQGRRNRATDPGPGRYVRARPDEQPLEPALDATIRAAVQRSAVSGGIKIERADLHRKERAGTMGTMILFLVDASGSMAARRRMEAVKGAVVSLLRDAYQQRDHVGVLTFRGPQAELLLSPTDSVERAEQALRILPTGGRTPLAHALVLAGEIISREQRARPDLPILLVILSDGKANVPLPETTGDPWQQALQAAAALAEQDVACLVLDTEVGYVRSGRAAQLAQTLGSDCLLLEDLSADNLVLRVRSRRVVER